MGIGVVLENGDIRLPADVLARLHVKPGDPLRVEADAAGMVHLYPRGLAVSEVYGCLAGRSPVTGTTIEQMDESIAESLRRDDP